jgi:hypothetical protein
MNPSEDSKKEDRKEYINFLSTLQNQILIKKSLQYSYDFINEKPLPNNIDLTDDDVNKTNPTLMSKLRPRSTYK